MQLDIITPEKTFFSATITMATIPGALGDFGVLPGHAPLISIIRPGVISIETETGETSRIGVMGGFAEVTPERCTVLAETALDFADVTPASVQALQDKATAELEEAASDAAKAVAEKKHAFAEALRLAMGH